MNAPLRSSAVPLSVTADTIALLDQIGVRPELYTGGSLPARSPITGETLAAVPAIGTEEALARIEAAHRAFRTWRNLEPGRRAKAESALRRIKAAPGLSRDLSDIVERALGTP